MKRAKTARGCTLHKKGNRANSNKQNFLNGDDDDDKVMYYTAQTHSSCACCTEFKYFDLVE